MQMSDESTASTVTVIHKASSTAVTGDFASNTPDLDDITTLTASTSSTTANACATSRKDFALAPLTPLATNTRHRHSSWRPHPDLPYVHTGLATASSPQSTSSSPRTPGRRHERKLSSRTRSYLFTYPLPLPTPWKEDSAYARQARLADLGSDVGTPLGFSDAEEGGEDEEVEHDSYESALRPRYSYEDAAFSPTVEALTPLDTLMTSRAKAGKLDGGVEERGVVQWSGHDGGDVVGENDQNMHSWHPERKRWSVGF